MKKVNRTKSDIILDIIYCLAGVVALAMLAAAVYMMVVVSL